MHMQDVRLNMYGCVHLVVTISFLNINVDYVVDPLLAGTVYMNSYKYSLHGMNVSNMWPTTKYIPPLPPMKRRMSARPTIKRRKRCF